MNHRLLELSSYLKRNIKLLCMIVLLGQLGVILALVVGCLRSNVTKLNNVYKETYIEGNYYILGDRFVGDAEAELTNNPEWRSILKQLNIKLNSSDLFTYLEMRNASLSIIGYSGSDTNLYNYEYGDGNLYKATTADGYSTVKAFMLGSKAFDHFAIEIEEGRGFTEEEYDLDNLKVMPILLGSNYRDAYKIGDIIQVQFVFFTGEAEVIGFLSDHASLTNSTQQISLSRYAVFPLFTPSETTGSQAYRMLYFQKNNGLIYSKASANDVQDLVSSYCNELGITGGYYVCGATNQYNNSTGMTLGTLAQVISYLTIGISLFTAVLFAIYVCMKIIKSGHYYAVLLINGFTTGDILWMIQAEILITLVFICSGGLLLGNLICSLLLPYTTVPFLWGILPAICSCIFAVPAALICYARTNIAIYLGKE